MSRYITLGADSRGYAHNAEVTAWSSNAERGVLTPDRCRVKLDMVTEVTEGDANAG